MVVSCSNDATRILSPLLETSDLASESSDILDIILSVFVLLLLVFLMKSIVSTLDECRLWFLFDTKFHFR